MSCIPIPELPSPALPGFSVSTPAIPGGDDVNIALCCKLSPIPIPIPPIPALAFAINPIYLEAIKAYIDQATVFINSLPLKCPLE